MAIEGLNDILKAEAEVEKMIIAAEIDGNERIKQAVIASEKALMDLKEAQAKQNKLELEAMHQEEIAKAKVKTDEVAHFVKEIEAQADLKMHTAVQLVVERIVT